MSDQSQPVPPPVDVPGHDRLVLSTDEIFAIDNSRLKAPIGSLGPANRARFRPAIDKVVSDY